jgi:TPR repeat protein
MGAGGETMVKQILIISVCLLPCVIGCTADESAVNTNTENLRTSAEQDDLESQFQLGTYHLQIKENEEAEKWLYRAAGRGHVEAQYKLGNYYDFTKNNEEAAKTWYRAAKEQGHEEASQALKAWESLESLKSLNDHYIETVIKSIQQPHQETLEALRLKAEQRAGKIKPFQ